MVLLTVSVLSLCAATGCSMAVGLGVKLIGSVVDSQDVKNRQEKLIGQPASAADDMFGPRTDALQDLHSDRVWRVYPVKGISNPLGKDSYVVEINHGRIVALSRVEETPDAKFDIPRAVAMEARVKGLPIDECERELDLGPPLLTARSESTGTLLQLYEGRIIESVGKAYYCKLKFDGDNICRDVEFQGVGASTKKDPYR